MDILRKASQRIPRHLSTKSGHGHVSDVLYTIVNSEMWHNIWVQIYSFIACSWHPTQVILQIQVGVPSLVKAISYCQKWLSCYMYEIHSDTDHSLGYLLTHPKGGPPGISHASRYSWSEWMPLSVWFGQAYCLKDTWHLWGKNSRNQRPLDILACNSAS